MKKKVLGLMFLILISLVGVVSAATSIYISPQSTTVEPGENFVVGVSINTTEDVYAISFDLYFNASILRGLSSGDGGFLGKDGENVLVAVNNINNAQGKFSFAATRAGTQVGVSGTGPIANITFNATNIRQSNLSIDNIQISNENLQAVPVTSLQNGTVLVNSVPTAPVVDLTPNSPKTTNDLTCTVTTPSTDNDSDTITYTYEWYKDSGGGFVLQPGETTTTTGLSDILSSAQTSKGEDWRCVVTPNDGYIDGPNGQDQVTIGNIAPVLEAIGNKEINEGQNLQFAVTGSDDDASDMLTFTSDNLPSGASFNPVFNWTPGYDQTGVYEVGFNVTDGTDMDSETITITVNNVNRNPIIDWFSPTSLVLEFREGLDLLFKQISHDPDGDVLNYEWKVNGVEKAFTQNWTYSPDTSQCGLRHIKLQVSDDGGYIDTRGWDITVNLRGDVDLDNDADIFDLARIGLAYSSVPGDANWNENADLFPGPQSNGTEEGDNTINIFDLASVGLNYGRSC